MLRRPITALVGPSKVLSRSKWGTTSAARSTSVYPTAPRAPRTRCTYSSGSPASDPRGSALPGRVVEVSTPPIHDSSRPRAGRRFQPSHELALLGPAVEACGALPGAHRGLTVIREMAGPFGIPDFTALVGPPSLLAARIALDIPPLLHQLDAGVVAVTHPRQGRSVTALARLLGWPEETVQRRIGDLVRQGALHEARPGRFVRPPELGPLGRLYAVEAKVREWGRAVRQGRTYSVWADTYVLVMGPLAERALQPLLKQVANDRAGLVVQGRWLARPAIHPLPAAQRLWAAEHVVAALRSGYQPSVAP